MGGQTSRERKRNPTDPFTDTVFSSSVEDISNENLYKDKQLMGAGESSNKLMLEVSKLKISLSTHHGGFRNRDQYYLPGPLFGPYSFVNISCGKEEMDDDDQHNRKNMVEVAVVVRAVQNLYKAWKGFRKQLSIAVASPYTAQVDEIKDKLGEKYKNLDKFIVKVLTFDELQGKEEDIIILSTVRSNCDGSLGLLSNNQRVNNVALTTARQCLWILGNERTLSKNDSVWKSIICDAKNRNCFFNIEEDKEMSDFVNEIKKELDQLDEVFDANSPLFKNARWKVLFSDNFRKSFGKIKSLQMKKLVMNLLLRLANGWRPKQRNVGIICDKSKLALKQFKVKDLYVICSVDIDHEEFRYIQVLKVWDLLPLVDIPKLVKRLDSMFLTYTDKFLNHCKEKCIEGGLEIPMSWETSHHIVRHKKSSCIQEGNNERRFLQDSKVGDSLLLTKFYSISSGMVSDLLSSCNGMELELPFELTRQEMEIINFGKSSFILGRSGTGKTTVLIRKLVQIEQLYHVASEGFHEFKGCRSSKFEIAEDGERVEESEETFLHQIFVTLNPRLCCAVKQHVSGLTRFACGEKSAEDSTSIRLDDMDDVSNFEEIPDSFVGLPPNLYPLVLTFHKFLIMLDGTLGNSFFDRFPEAKEDSNESSKSMALTTFIRMKEVNFHKFNISYWPHFKKKLTNGLDPSTVFAEITSYIKGGLQAWNVRDGKLSCKDYISLSSSRVSTLSEPERQQIYEIFMQYEKKKKMNVEYDLADLVTDLHLRLKEKEYEAAKFDFVYIDEVQDLTMGQIALFRHVCRNVEGGFVFAGDTAQTIAKGIDFRFEDIRHLFYEEFVMKSRGDRIYGRGEKGVIAGISQLSQNFRTHAGVLKLAQSVIDLVYHFFPLSIDPLNPETSLIDGETPVLVESRNGKIEFSFMLSNSGDCGRSLVGFGADQVVLVRDDNVKNEILKYSGNHALILTISECKGLEFQDVLLYNFLSSSPIKEQWNLIYSFMKEKNILGHTSRWSFPSLDHAKHRLLCSELKQLYVAITRTRQRLWILETGDGEGFSAPMCDYWKTMQLVKVRGLDDSFLEEIQVCSSKEEWKSRGIKLFKEQKYEPAKMCFERAGEAFLAKWAEASGLRAAAWNISTSNSDVAGVYLKNAAIIFNSIEKFEEAAKCFYESKEYNLAGSIYLENFGDSKLQEAGECFVRARSYERAAFAYAKGNFFTKCLESCLQGKLFNKGLHYIPYWKDHATQNNYMTRDMNEIDAIHPKSLNY
ncbi:TPR and ankyrin repeat-containing protein 1 [Morus notabilis]|uniref:TPR and ankyrin repeat-containing protein 1 n=1 Tax=Morus notabilis TaxID=981085 RepID=UPI000CED39F0|nr:TPR and ankyrin repeat-containing protein 1 [Morus notabilis]